MEVLQAIVLGILQGLTEFLPISSSGHLVLGSQIMGFEQAGVSFEVFLHLGSLLAVLVVFWSDIKGMIIAPFAYLRGSREKDIIESLIMAIYIVVATMPAVVVGLFFKDSFESIFNNLVIVYCMLIVTGTLMVVTQFLPTRDKKMSVGKSILVGCAQACAILPGLSRSGSTIFMGMLLGVDRQKIARFSFLMSIPAILGAVVLQIGDVAAHPLPPNAIVNILVGSVASAISGYFAIKLLLDLIKKNRLQWFGYYCYAVATLGLIHHFIL
ncbi:MAG: undecaprenyl-diphosphate phosphatase [Desulfotalea sp.]